MKQRTGIENGTERLLWEESTLKVFVIRGAGKEMVVPFSSTLVCLNRAAAIHCSLLPPLYCHSASLEPLLSRNSELQQERALCFKVSIAWASLRFCLSRILALFPFPVRP